MSWRMRVLWSVLLLLMTACYSNDWDDLFGPVQLQDELAAPVNVAGGTGGCDSHRETVELPDIGVRNSAASAGSSSSSSSAASSSSSSGGATTCLTCDTAVQRFRDMQGPWSGFCTNPDNAAVWKLAQTCFCDSQFGGCSDACGPYCSGDRGPIPPGSACDECTRNHEGKCGPILNACSQASEPFTKH